MSAKGHRGFPWGEKMAAGSVLDREIPKVIEELMSSGGMVPAQMPSPSHWTPEVQLAAAVLASALMEIREHCGNPRHRRLVAQDLAWLWSNNTNWPFSFVRICYLLRIEPAWVRRMVKRWQREAAEREGRYRPAA